MSRKKYFLVYEVSFLSLMAALVYVLKTFLKTPIGVPGHNAVLWVIPFIIGIGLLQKFGSGTYIGVLSGLLIGFVGGADTGPFKVFEYIAMGFTMDVLAVIFKGHLANILVGVILGAFGSFDKLLVNSWVSIFLHVNANVIILGIGVAGTSHLIFGGIGGALAALIVNRVQHIRFPNHVNQKNGGKELQTQTVRLLCTRKESE